MMTFLSGRVPQGLRQAGKWYDFSQQTRLAEFSAGWISFAREGPRLLRDCHVDELIHSYTLRRSQTRDRRTANDQLKVAVKCPDSIQLPSHRAAQTPLCGPH